MLSYKLKHLCSQVFASLAAFGLFSVGGGEARAELKSPSGTFNFAGSAANFTVTAAWADKCTIPSTFKGISGAAYTDQGSGSGYCTYTCKNGYFYREGSSDVTSVTGITGTDGNFTPGGDCYPKPSCTTGAWSGTGVYIKNTLNSPTIGFDAGKGYYCKATCKDGFGTSATAGAGTSQKTAYATSTAELTVPACVGRNFTMKVDCGASGIYSGTSYSTGTVSVQYGKTITLPDSAQCIWAGHTLNGYDVPSSAISK